MSMFDKIKGMMGVPDDDDYDDDDMGFDNSDLALGDDVMVESELAGDYSIEDADADAEFEEEDEEPNPEDLESDDLFADLPEDI
jgi:DNA-directed RNA polymerase subunit beta